MILVEDLTLGKLLGKDEVLGPQVLQHQDEVPAVELVIYASSFQLMHLSLISLSYSRAWTRLIADVLLLDIRTARTPWIGLILRALRANILWLITFLEFMISVRQLAK